MLHRYRYGHRIDADDTSRRKEHRMGKRITGLAAVLVAVGLAGCAQWDRMSDRDRATATGAAVGGATGAAATGGGTIGTVGGAAVGGVIGREMHERRERRQ
jgi:osmotically inducible lipoprotein OsmB